MGPGLWCWIDGGCFLDSITKVGRDSVINKNMGTIRAADKMARLHYKEWGVIFTDGSDREGLLRWLFLQDHECKFRQQNKSVLMLSLFVPK